MAKKLTIEFIKEEFRKEGYTLLTEEYKNNKQKLEYICPKRHKSSITWHNWVAGHRCLKCSGKKKLTIEFIREQFEKEGYILLTKKYKNNKSSLDYICSGNHNESISWDSWNHGHRCMSCSRIVAANKKRLTTSFVRSQFEKEGYFLLTKKYINSKQKLKYICPKGHKHDITWSDWKQGYRCLTCGGSEKLTIGFVKKQFEKEGYKLLSKEYKNAYTKLEYSCRVGHKGNIVWNSWQHGSRCRRCSIQKRKNKNSPHWNPSLTDEDRLNRRLIPGYKEWAYAVKKRDNFTCQICGDNRGGNLVSHHIESYNDNPDLRIALDNGVCLCEKCHKKFHSMYGYGNNTRKQFEEFISIGV